MNHDALQFTRDQAGVSAILAHLQACDASFVPPLSARVDLATYAAKLHEKAARFEAWSGSELVGLLAGYLPAAPAREAFISNVSVSPAWHSQGIAPKLLAPFVTQARHQGLLAISLEVGATNVAARRLYERAGFQARPTPAESSRPGAATSDSLVLTLSLTPEEQAP